MKKEIVGNIFDLQRFCINDGPGIRTVFFFKGCPLRCKWCHNPESWIMEPQLMVRSHKCAGCGQCAQVCAQGVHTVENGVHTVDFTRCRTCFRCLDVCCYSALEILGKQITVAEAVRLLEPDREYYGQNGGVTLSGGEPLMQPEFVAALAESVKREGIHVCVETCGYAQPEIIERIAPHTDLFLFDWKAGSDEKHRELTGVSNMPIIHNLRLLEMAGKTLVLRCPLIPGVNDTQEDLKAIADIYHTHKNITNVELLAYHAMGEAKKVQLGNEADRYPVRPPTDEMKREWLRELGELGCPAVFG